MNKMHLFAGVNSPAGFYSRFDEIMDEKNGGRKIYIKGGPGMGKSSLMKKLSGLAEARGHLVELYHCSSDPESLDGVYIPELDFAIVDATAPHTGDPIYPCACGEVLDVSAFADSEKIRKEREAIVYLSEKKKALFLKGYSYLEAVRALIKSKQESGEKHSIVNCIHKADALSEKIFDKKMAEKEGNVRKLFLSAITPDGIVDYADDFLSHCDAVIVKGTLDSSAFLKRLGENAVIRGYDVVRFYCPMFPSEKVVHIYLPQLDLFVSAEKNFQWNNEGGSRHQLLLKELIDGAVGAFSEAREMHKKLESIYIPCMDFDGLTRKTESLIQSIL